MSNMKIKSSLRDYEVIYIKKLIDVGEKFASYTEKDVIIVDKKVKEMWSSLFFEVTAQIIEIDATEKTKSYYKIGDIIEQLIKNEFKKTWIFRPTNISCSL